MKARKDKYMAMLIRFDEAQQSVYRRFRRYAGENYAFGFAFQSASRDFILYAPDLST